MKKFSFSIFFLIFTLQVFSQNQNNGKENDKKGITIGNIIEMSGNWFISYRNGIEQIHADQDIPAENVVKNEFLLKRSYFTLKKNLNDVFSVRYTMDLTVDNEGEDAGNVETRLKYLYLKAKPKIKSSSLSGTFIEVGMVHTPWLDFEQSINTYRVQDNMAIERNKLINSADFGLTIGGNIGPKMDDNFLKNVSDAMEGKYASYVIGVYNGAGYSGKEKNNNKVLEGRISFRPFPEKVPEITLSAFGLLGKGNNIENPDFKQVLGYLAYSGKQLTVATQYHKGIGDFRAIYLDNNYNALKNSGYSLFSEYKFKNTHWAIWGRMDHFEVKETENYNTKRYIGGLTYRINEFLRLVANAERNESLLEDNNIYELNIEISF